MGLPCCDVFCHGQRSVCHWGSWCYQPYTSLFHFVSTTSYLLDPGVAGLPPPDCAAPLVGDVL